MTDPREDDGIPLANLNWEQLGRALAMLVPTSVMLHHASINSTLRDYVHPEPLSETDFIRDLFTLPLNEVIAKWYGSRDNAATLAAAVMDEVLGGADARGDGGPYPAPSGCPGHSRLAGPPAGRGAGRAFTVGCVSAPPRSG